MPRAGRTQELERRGLYAQWLVPLGQNGASARGAGLTRCAQSIRAQRLESYRTARTTPHFCHSGCGRSHASRRAAAPAGACVEPDELDIRARRTHAQFGRGEKVFCPLRSLFAAGYLSAVQAPQWQRQHCTTSTWSGMEPFRPLT